MAGSATMEIAVDGGGTSLAPSVTEVSLHEDPCRKRAETVSTTSAENEDSSDNSWSMTTSKSNLTDTTRSSQRSGTIWYYPSDEIDDEDTDGDTGALDFVGHPQQTDPQNFRSHLLDEVCRYNEILSPVYAMRRKVIESGVVMENTEGMRSTGKKGIEITFPVLYSSRSSPCTDIPHSERGHDWEERMETGNIKKFRGGAGDVREVSRAKTSAAIAGVAKACESEEDLHSSMNQTYQVLALCPQSPVSLEGGKTEDIRHYGWERNNCPVKTSSVVVDPVLSTVLTSSRNSAASASLPTSPIHGSASRALTSTKAVCSRLRESLLEDDVMEVVAEVSRRIQEMEREANGEKSDSSRLRLITEGVCEASSSSQRSKIHVESSTPTSTCFSVHTDCVSAANTEAVYNQLDQLEAEISSVLDPRAINDDLIQLGRGDVRAKALTSTGEDSEASESLEMAKSFNSGDDCQSVVNIEALSSCESSWIGCESDDGLASELGALRSLQCDLKQELENADIVVKAILEQKGGHRDTLTVDGQDVMKRLLAQRYEKDSCSETASLTSLSDQKDTKDGESMATSEASPISAIQRAFSDLPFLSNISSSPRRVRFSDKNQEYVFSTEQTWSQDSNRSLPDYLSSTCEEVYQAVEDLLTDLTCGVARLAPCASSIDEADVQQEVAIASFPPAASIGEDVREEQRVSAASPRVSNQLNSPPLTKKADKKKPRKVRVSTVYYFA